MGAQLGRHIEQNQRQTIPVNGTPFDDFAVRVADASIAKVRPDATVTLLRASDPALYKVADAWLDGDNPEVKQLISFILEAVAQSPDARVLLTVEAHERVVLGTTRSAARAEDRVPWNALSQEQKVRTLQLLLKQGIEGALPRMLSSKPQ